MHPSHRLNYIDTIRGMALFIMLFANSVPLLFDEDPHFLIKALNSMAAPMFIAVSGFLCSYSRENALFFQSHFLLRGFLLLIIATLIDLLLFKRIPFTEPDILYLLGFAYILASILGKIPTFWLTAILLSFVLIGHFIVSKHLYPFHHLPKYLDTSDFSYSTQDLRYFLIGGSFPLIPWFSVFLFGYIGGRIKMRTGRYKLVASIILLIVAAFSLVLLNNSTQFNHLGHSELFYPASLLFLLFSFCLMASFWVNHTTFSNRYFILFSVLGKTSLFAYLFHLVFLIHVMPLIASLTNKNLYGSMFIFYAATFSIVFLIDYTKKNTSWKKSPYLIRFIFGS